MGLRACGLRAWGLMSLRAKGFSMGLYFWCYKLELVILKLLTLKLVTFELWGSLGFPGPLSLCKKFKRTGRVAQGIPAKPSEARSSKVTTGNTHSMENRPSNKNFSIV